MSWKEIAGAAAPIVGQGLGLLTADMDDRRQLEQQGKLGKQQLEFDKERARHSNELALDMMNKTSYKWQVEQMKKAGLSVGAMMSKGGGGQAMTGAEVGGAGGGGQAANAAQSASVRNELGLQAAQIQNLMAETEKTKAEKANIEEQTGATNWATELSKKLNTDTYIKDVQEQQKWATERLETTARKEMQEWDTAIAAGFTKDGKKYTFNDPESPMAKAMKAGFEKTVTEAKNLGTAGKIAEAEKTIKEFEAGLTRQGIAAGSPWYVKIVGDLLGKVGISLTGDTAKVVK